MYVQSVFYTSEQKNLITIWCIHNFVVSHVSTKRFLHISLLIYILGLEHKIYYLTFFII